MYKRTPTTPTSDYARWLAEEDTDLTGPPGSSSKPKFAPADPSPEPTLKLPTTSKADGSVLEQVVEVMKPTRGTPAPDRGTVSLQLRPGPGLLVLDAGALPNPAVGIEHRRTHLS